MVVAVDQAHDHQTELFPGVPSAPAKDLSPQQGEERLDGAVVRASSTMETQPHIGA